MRIRRVCEKDISALVQVHLSSFPGFFLSHMGPAFLTEYYRLIIGFGNGICLVAEDDGGIEGFVAGFANPSAFYQLMRASKRRLAIPIALGILRNPLIVPKLIANVRRVGEGDSGDEQLQGRLCELASIAVHPNSSRRGVGKALVAAFIEESAKLMANCVYLTTDATDNQYVNDFYGRLGFQLLKTYSSTGNRLMNKYALMLSGLGMER